MAQQPAGAPSNLQQHFATGSTGDTSRWAELWKTKFTPWDRGMPNPALHDLLRGRKDIIGSCWQETGGGRRRKKALVPGCGRGYDVLLLASFGYDAYGLEIEEAAIEQCKEVQKRDGDKYQVQDGVDGAGAVEYLLADFFDVGWSKGIDGFDLIYDYTFFCALPPSSRPKWAMRMQGLLQASGRLICLEFPTYKNPKDPGPPFGLTHEMYKVHLENPGDEVPYGEDGHVANNSPSGNTLALVVVDHWQPKRTHKIGEGTDWICVWRHQS